MQLFRIPLLLLFFCAGCLCLLVDENIYPRVRERDITALTFVDGRQTAARRIDPRPQLVCQGDACATSKPPTMRCINEGFNGVAVQWKCEAANMDPSLRIGEAIVRCEGYERPGDEYVLAGSCALTYELLGKPMPTPYPRPETQPFYAAHQEQMKIRVDIPAPPVNSGQGIIGPSGPTGMVGPRGISSNDFDEAFRQGIREQVIRLKAKEEAAQEDRAHHFITFYCVIALVVLVCMMMWCTRSPADTHTTVREVHTPVYGPAPMPAASSVTHVSDTSTGETVVTTTTTTPSHGTVHRRVVHEEPRMVLLPSDSHHSSTTHVVHHADSGRSGTNMWDWAVADTIFGSRTQHQSPPPQVHVVHQSPPPQEVHHYHETAKPSHREEHKETPKATLTGYAQSGTSL
jgi:hypothetical protein